MIISHHLLESLVNPFFLCFILFALLLIKLWRKRNNSRLCWAFLIGMVVLFFCSTAWLPQSLTRQLEEYYSPISQLDPSVHWIVILSGGQYEKNTDKPINNVLSSASLKRLLEGIRLYRQLPQAKLVLSGGGNDLSNPEALNLAQIVAWLSIPKANVVLEAASINTVGQAYALKSIVKEEPFYLVTSAIHMPRSMALFKAQGLRAIPAPTDYTYFWNEMYWDRTIIPNPYNLFYLSIALHEWLGRAWAKLHSDYASS